jgi:arginyl-tRNA synthetase
MLKRPHFDIPLPEHPQKVIVEFSSPNTAKELHVGHLRSTIIGDSLARLFEFLGENVLRLNHVGDWGTQFGMLIAYMKAHHSDVLKKQREASLPDLMEWYKAAKVAFDADPAFKKRSQLEVVALQGGNPESLDAWKEICAISRKGYQEIYDLLDVRLTERGESYYNPVLGQTVADLEAKGIVENSQGAKCIFIEGLPIPFMIQKSDGGYNYDTTDMAAIRQRIEEEKADRIIYVTDLGQSLHFQLLFKAAEKAGWLNPAKVRVDHVTFGLVLGNDGKKFKTRSGDTEKLIDLLLTAVQEAEKILESRSPEMDPSERKALAKALGLSAVKYADLSCHRTSDYVFAYDKMLRFEGNTAAYMMYSYVRVLGIKRKIGAEADALINSATLRLEHPSEVALALALARFEEVLNGYAESLLPHRLTDYLYQLADKFNAFFRDCRVEGTAEVGSRLLLAETTAKVLKQGFDLLGLITVEKM